MRERFSQQYQKEEFDDEEEVESTVRKRMTAATNTDDFDEF